MSQNPNSKKCVSISWPWLLSGPTGFHCGVPQGSVAGATEFISYTEDFQELMIIHSDGCDLADVFPHVEVAVQLNAQDGYVVYWSDNCRTDMDAEVVLLKSTQRGTCTEPYQFGLVGVELLEIQGQTWCNAFNDISGSIYHRNVCLVSMGTKLMSRYSKIYITISWPWPLTFKCKFKVQTWRNAFNMISLVVYIVETCVWCLKSPNRSRGIGSF